MDQHEGRCEDGTDAQCPICRGDVSDEFFAMIEQAAAQPGRVMTGEEAIEWLRTL